MENNTAESELDNSSQRQPMPKRIWFTAIPLLIALVAGGTFLLWRRNPSAIYPAGQMPRNETLEQRWGIRVTQIGVTADNGLIDFRYLVLDPDKALSMFDDEKTEPQLIAESSGDAITAKVPMVHKHDLRTGEVYFVLFYNPQGLVKPGTALAVKIGDLQLDHVVAR